MPATATTRSRPVRCGPRQLALFAAVYLAYEAGRALTTGSVASAVAHARTIVGLEHRLGIAIERPLQAAVVHTPLSVALSVIYLAAQLAVVPGVLAWAYRRDRGVYVVARNTVVASWALALPIYAALPTAPPRLAGLGFVDVVSSHTHINLDSNFTTILYNPLAAMPSLHTGFAFAVGIVVFALARSRLVCGLGLLWGPLVAWAVVATGNHYLLDVAAGVLVTGAGFAVGLLAARLPWPPRMRLLICARETPVLA